MTTHIQDADIGGCDGRYRAADRVWGDVPEPTLVGLAARGRIAGRDVLDAGCGDGRNAAWLAGAGARVVATDVSKLALAAARQNHAGRTGIQWQQADLRALPVAPASFDGVVACSVLHWLRTVAEIATVFDSLSGAVRPGGWLVLTVFTDRHAYVRTATDTRMPCLLPHGWFAERLGGAPWRVLTNTDTDLAHSHTGHEEFHTHAVTCLVAERE